MQFVQVKYTKNIFRLMEKGANKQTSPDDKWLSLLKDTRNTDNTSALSTF